MPKTKQQILLYLFLILATSILSQTAIDSIKSNAKQIPVEWSAGNKFAVNFSDTIAQILQTDVFGYFKLEGQYDTEQKKKAFLNSVEGKSKKQVLTERRKSLVTRMFYIELDDYNAKYNTTTKAVELHTQFYDNGYNYSKQVKHLQIDHLVLLSNANGFGNKVSEVMENPEDSRDRKIKQTIGIKVPSEAIALKIEENIKKTQPGKGSNVKFVFLFKLTSSETVSGRVNYDGKTYFRKEDLVIGQLKTVIIYDRVTGTIYNKAE